MLQIQRMIEVQNPKSGCWELDRLDDVGSAFEDGENLYNYVKAVLPRPDWWNLQVAETSGDLDEYGVAAEREVSDLSEWMKKRERITAETPVVIPMTTAFVLANHAGHFPVYWKAPKGRNRGASCEMFSDDIGAAYHYGTQQAAAAAMKRNRMDAQWWTVAPVVYDPNAAPGDHWRMSQQPVSA